jgi:hypothetical protein
MSAKPIGEEEGSGTRRTRAQHLADIEEDDVPEVTARRAEG